MSELEAIAEGAAGGDDGILEANRSDADSEVYR
jgi:hypothetical protein